VKPATPPQHLVSYVVLTDPSRDRVLLVDHVNARLWLPPGGHVEPDEDPVEAARRELSEELGIVATHIEFPDRPIFVTITQTVGIDRGHTDVSLWFHHTATVGHELRLDRQEFTDVRWWSAADVVEAHSVGFDPHMTRVLGKLGAARVEG